MKKTTVVTLLAIALTGCAEKKDKKTWTSGNPTATPVPTGYNTSTFPPWWWWWMHGNGGYYNGGYYAPHSYYAPAISAATARSSSSVGIGKSFSSSARGGFGSSAVGSSAS